MFYHFEPGRVVHCGKGDCWEVDPEILGDGWALSFRYVTLS